MEQEITLRNKYTHKAIASYSGGRWYGADAPPRERRNETITHDNDGDGSPVPLSSPHHPSYYLYHPRKRERSTPGGEDVVISEPSNGIAYEDEELQKVLKQYPKCSRERGKAKELMLKKGYVSSEANFYRKTTNRKNFRVIRMTSPLYKDCWREHTIGEYATRKEANEAAQREGPGYCRGPGRASVVGYIYNRSEYRYHPNDKDIRICIVDIDREESMVSTDVKTRLESWRRQYGYIPDYVNLQTGHYKYGIRKCSHCKEFKDKSAFSKEEEKKSAARRICIACISLDGANSQVKSKSKDYTSTAVREAQKNPDFCSPPSSEEVTIPEPAHGEAYKDEDVMKILSKYPKGSSERGKVTKLILQGGYVTGCCYSRQKKRSRSTLYKHVKKFEDKEQMREDVPPLPGDNGDVASTVRSKSSLGLGYDGYYITDNGLRRHIAKWKGSVILVVTPVTFLEGEKMSAVDISHPLNIDICDLIGNSDIVSELPKVPPNRMTYLPTAQDPSDYNPSSSFAELCRREKLLPLKWDRHIKSQPFQTAGGATSDQIESGFKRRITKLYFPPKSFAPPGNDCPDKVVLSNLRKYIRHAAKDGGSPVICVGQSNPNEMRFRCKYWYRRRKTKACDDTDEKSKKHSYYNSYCCTFTFAVKWDKFGYYIPLLRTIEADCNVGFAWHCCEPPHKVTK